MNNCAPRSVRIAALARARWKLKPTIRAKKNGAHEIVAHVHSNKLSHVVVVFVEARGAQSRTHHTNGFVGRRAYNIALMFVRFVFFLYVAFCMQACAKGCSQHTHSSTAVFHLSIPSALAPGSPTLLLLRTARERARAPATRRGSRFDMFHS